MIAAKEREAKIGIETERAERGGGRRKLYIRWFYTQHSFVSVFVITSVFKPASIVVYTSLYTVYNSQFFSLEYLSCIYYYRELMLE